MRRFSYSLPEFEWLPLSEWKGTLRYERLHHVAVRLATMVQGRSS